MGMENLMHKGLQCANLFLHTFQFKSSHTASSV